VRLKHGRGLSRHGDHYLASRFRRIAGYGRQVAHGQTRSGERRGPVTAGLIPPEQNALQVLPQEHQMELVALQKVGHRRAARWDDQPNLLPREFMRTNPLRHRSHLKFQIWSSQIDLANEATVEPGNEEPRIKH
jgi:hypothetical protein